MTVEQWLGADNQLGINIWKNKYQHNEESFYDWIMRVSGGDPEVADLIVSKKFLPGGRILSNRGINDTKVTYSNCFSGDTKILTDNGVRRLDELVGKNVKVLSENSWRDATVRSFGVQPVKELTIEKRGVERKIIVTGDHIWFASTPKQTKFHEVQTNNLEPGMKLQRDLLLCYRTYKPSPFGVAHGFFYGDGDHVGNARRVSFCGDKTEMLQYFTPDTVGMSGSVSTICGIPKIFWAKPSLQETKSYLYGWLAGYFAADGSIDERGACVLCSSKREDLEFVQDVLCVLGIPSEEIRVQNRVSNLTGKASNVYILSLCKHYLNENFFVLTKHRKRFVENNQNKIPDYWKVKSVSPVVGEQEVFCAVVPETSSFCLAGNILTHNCYVIAAPEDNLESIYDSRKKLARTYSYGGGCGIDLSKLSPAGAVVRNQARHTSGAVSFMEGYSKTTEEVGQNGRRGALMISLSCEHPDLEEFIDVKAHDGAVTKANISVRVTDAFMQAVENDEDWTMSFTRPETGETITKTASAKYLFDKLCQNNWDWGEPGILFWDRIQNWNLLSNNPEFEYAGVNPCAEEPLPAGGSCLLGSINLAEFVKPDKTFDYNGFEYAIMVGVKYLNDVLDEGLPLHPLQEQRDSVRSWRQIGLGIMGLADALIKMEITYGSQAAVALCDEISAFMANRAIFASALLARDHGAYPKYNLNVTETDYFVQSTSPQTKEWVNASSGLRNSQLLTIAPTGTLSTMLGISGGIEPIFANSYTRKTESLHGEDVYYKVYTPIVDAFMKAHSVEDEDDLPEWFVTSAEIDPVNRVKMQAAWQQGIDASISSTVNLPNSATVEDVKDIYMTAWKAGLKGITVFRAGCKRAGVLTTGGNGTAETAAQRKPVQLKRGDIIECSEDLVGKKRKLTTGCVDCDTEFFNGTEWKKISEYQDDDLVLQYNLDGTAELVRPLSYIKRPSEGMYHFKTKYGLDMMVSKDHRNVTFNRNPKKPKVMTTDKIISAHTGCKTGFARSFKKSFVFNGPGINLSDDEIRISIAIFADGCFYSPTSKKCLVSVTKKRKRDRLISLLNKAGIEHSENIAPDGYYEIKFYPPIKGKQKTFPNEWYQCSQHQLQVIFDEVFNWDGFAAKKNQYTTIHKCNADFIQFVCSAVGKSSAIYVDDRGTNDTCHTCYRVDWSNRVLRSIIERPKKEISFVQPRDGYDYCFSVPSTMLVLRRNNEIFITGNCGSLHVLGFFDPVTGELQECYLNKGSTGGCANFMTGLGRTISLLCRAGVSVYDIKDQLDSTGSCPSYASRKATKHDASKGACCPMAIGNALIDMYEEMQSEIDDSWETETAPHEEAIKNPPEETSAKCPECGSALRHEGGCDLCPSCGWSHCG